MASKKTARKPTLEQADNGEWWFVVDLGPGPNGKGEWRERRQAKRRGFRTKREAQDTMDELRVASRQGTYVAPKHQMLKDYLEQDWLPAQRHQLAELTWASYERNMRLHVVPNIGGVQLQALDAGHLNRLYVQLLESGRRRTGKGGSGLSARTVRYVATILHSALGDAVKQRRIQLNPADQASPPSAKKAKPPEMKTWTAGELASFLERTDGDRHGYVWGFLATTGCRRGEALGLRWTDLDLESVPASALIYQQVLPMPRENGRGREAKIVDSTKGGEPRVIELDGHTVAMLKRWKAKQAEERLLVGAGFRDHGLVFPKPDGTPFQPDVLTKTFDRRLRQAAFTDLPTIRQHDLRHTWATLALEAGVDVAVVSKRLGHSSPTVTWNTYQHVRRGMQSDAAERVAASIFK